jgi:hypothetical protein
MAVLPTWVAESTFVKESRATFDDLPQDIQMAVLYPKANPYELLKALTFFLYYVVPSFFLPFMMDVDADECLEGIDNLFLLQDVKDFQAMMQLAADARMPDAAAKGKVQWIIYLRQTGHSWGTSTCAAAAEHGHLACLQYLHTNGCAWDAKTTEAALGFTKNQMDCFNYAARLGCDITWCNYERMAAYGNVESLQIMYESGIRFDDDDPVCSVAAMSGSLPCLKWAYEKGAPEGLAFLESAWMGELDCLIYAHEQGFEDNGGFNNEYFRPDLKGDLDRWSINALEAACYCNHLDCFKFLHQLGYTSRVNLCFVAAYGGSLSCLDYAREIGHSLNDQVSLYALECDSVECVQYAYEHGCNWDRRFIGLAVGKKAYKCIKYAYLRNCPVPAERRNARSVPLPTWFTSSPLVERCAPVPPSLIFRCLTAAHRKTVRHRVPQAADLYITLKSLGYTKMPVSTESIFLGWKVSPHSFMYREELHTDINAFQRVVALGDMIEALRQGRVGWLKFLHENGHPWDEFTLWKAAVGGKLECLQYMIANGCPGNADACAGAALGGHLECLRLLHVAGYEWNERTCANAATGGHLNCLRYAREHGCPWDEHTVSNAFYGHRLDCLEYLQSQGGVGGLHSALSIHEEKQE